MAAAAPDRSRAPDPADGLRQYWLDVARPVQLRQPPSRRPSPIRRQAGDPPAGRQLELTMVAPAPPAPVPPAAPAPVRGPAPPAMPASAVARPAEYVPSVAPARPCFATWLRNQSKRGGVIGELAKAARLDPLFPKTGSADAVRAHFSRAGADGDAFEALDDAERAYDRLG